jgi:hypothetical protein
VIMLIYNIWMCNGYDRVAYELKMEGWGVIGSPTIGSLTCTKHPPALPRVAGCNNLASHPCPVLSHVFM